ncbi:MAG: HypC/HybG/HupF family hydrogenase formation chaperone [Candidatus Margulisiibacteriota bacterium]|nr:MAG: hypothetical protein A2X43_09090 [Candidatus Margulisbacteria bacterium GWD2_39_127]OGI03579.1 MAG: hypothetical protein A2X42_00930 [Candidatus Margulisbacteria bacterium GWF2_38_17]OGI11083.1 MAG: hypothetical protein A2X41_02225 [Candidatus Margulisbacteria bacterium GWE2_39_32]PZM77083.1 MAG: HypC/HybG/HupF family hydrogenase formation chaperone [Candidatus Margulisiibacteriota bacterium]HAR62320.1 HypC/HybG/HupF family hydrogenase formation chaperone [Candidatus Margulisiibacteriot
MCLGIPAMVIEKGDNNSAIVSVQDIKQKISIALVDVNIGDWVLVHAGFAINKLEEADAQETLQILKELEIL